MRSSRQRRWQLLRQLAAAAVLTAGLGGCSLPDLAQLPKIPASALTNISLPSLPVIDVTAGEPGRVSGPPSEIYRLIASGSARCWFAPRSPLKTTHIFHADAEPPAKGGAVEVAVLVRDLAAPKPWGPRAFRVMLTADGDYTAINVQNLSMDAEVAAQMRADVFHWAQDGRQCKLKPPPEEAGPPPPPAKAAKVKVAKKPKPAAAPPKSE
jgi:hypothetical protein